LLTPAELCSLKVKQPEANRVPRLHNWQDSTNPFVKQVPQPILKTGAPLPTAPTDLIHHLGTGMAQLLMSSAELW
jgi:hypothetical protein